METKYKIIGFLKDASEYVSGEEISRACGMSRAAIWKYMQELRQEGFDVVAVPHLGYKLLSAPDKLFPSEIQHGLKTRYLGRKIIYEDMVESTMNVAFDLGIKGACEGTVVCAEGQSRGKGRLGRSWQSPKGKGIYMSLILRPSLPPTEVAQLTLLTAVAVCEAVQSVCGIVAQIKWPNDILVGDRKLAGILTELNAEADCVKFIVIGIGINVESTGRSPCGGILPVRHDYRRTGCRVNSSLNALVPQATSLKEETQTKVSRIQLLQEILLSLENWYERLKKEGFSTTRERWKELSSTLGTRVRIVDSGGEIEGEAVDLNAIGGLIIRSDSGIATSKMAGDVVQVR